MKKCLLIVTALFMTVGCKEIEGVLTVDQELHIMKDAKVDAVIQPGSYEVEIKDDEDDHRLKIEVKDAIKGKDYKFRYTYPVGFEFPENGEFMVYASESNQIYDMQGVNTKTQSLSDVRSEYERCSLPPYKECYYDHYGRPHCRYVNRDGYRRVEYRIRTTEYTTELELLYGASTVASMYGDRTISERMYEYEGYCRR